MDEFDSLNEQDYEYWTYMFTHCGAMAALEQQRLTTLDFAILASCAERALTPADVICDFSAMRSRRQCIDYPFFIPIDAISGDLVHRALHMLLTTGIIEVVDDERRAQLRSRVASDGGLLANFMLRTDWFPRLGTLSPRDRGIEILLEIGRLLGWKWAQQIRISQFCVMTCQSEQGDGPVSCGGEAELKYAVCQYDCVRRRSLPIGHWWSSGRIQHKTGIAFLCHRTTPNKDWFDFGPTSLEMQLWSPDP